MDTNMNSDIFVSTITSPSGFRGRKRCVSISKGDDISKKSCKENLEGKYVRNGGENDVDITVDADDMYSSMDFYSVDLRYSSCEGTFDCGLKGNNEDGAWIDGELKTHMEEEDEECSLEDEECSLEQEEEENLGKEKGDSGDECTISKKGINNAIYNSYETSFSPPVSKIHKDLVRR